MLIFSPFHRDLGAPHMIESAPVPEASGPGPHDFAVKFRHLSIEGPGIDIRVDDHINSRRA
jgi:hypothetical protein